MYGIVPYKHTTSLYPNLESAHDLLLLPSDLDKSFTALQHLCFLRADDESCAACAAPK
jgi:hypothetical protein